MRHRFADPGGGLRLERRQVGGRQPHADAEPRAGAADLLHDARQQAGAAGELAAVGARARVRGQQLVQQVAVAALDVDEVETGALRHRGGLHHAFADALQFGVAEQGRGRVESIPLREQRMLLGQARPQLAVGSGEAAAVRQLQADHHRLGIAADLGAAVPHLGQQGDQVAFAVLVQAQLVGVGATAGRHRERLAAPDQRCPAAAEVAPAPQRVQARGAVAGAVPALHRLRAEAVVQGAAEQPQRLRQGPARSERVVESELDAVLLQVGPEVGDRAKLAGSGEAHRRRIMAAARVRLHCRRAAFVAAAAAGSGSVVDGPFLARPLRGALHPARRP